MRLQYIICVAAIVAATVVGCAPVRENRQIDFSADGTSVGFQHGKEGVFVADSEGGGLKKIFTPSKDTLAVSSPLFSPTDKRLVFTTATPLPGQDNTPTATNPLDPAGAIHTQRPAVYTCWLRGDKDGDRPEPLFKAECDHVGYVAANLAVRWHPKEDRILFLDRADNGKHGVFEFDLASKKTSRAFPFLSAAVIFDFAPDNEHLVCVADDGIWIGKPGTRDWWHVPGSNGLAEGELPSRIEQLRATRPAWADGGRFAFASCEVLKNDVRTGKHLLLTGDLAKREVTTVAESDTPFRNLRWAKDGRLGVVQGRALRVVKNGKLGPALKTRPVREFAGWSADRKHLAYVAHDFSEEELKEWKALLFTPDPLARDSVFLTSGDADSPGREALSGVRVTFPHWSPTEDRLSFWGTFTPSHRSWLATALGSALLRPGDPAAVIDLSTGKLTWMPVSPGEKAQVGHYHLLKRDYAEAWRWYEQARADDAKAGPDDLRLSAADDFSFFEYYCLTKLKRHAEAKAKLEQFRKTYEPSVGNIMGLPRGIQINGRDVEGWARAIRSQASLSGQLLRDLYQGEVFLSLGAAADGETHFRKAAESAKNDNERLSRTVLLAQMLLAQKKWREYGRLTAASLLPLAVKLYDPKNLDNFLAFDDAEVQQLALVATVGPTLLPLVNREVLADCDTEDLKASLPLLEQLADRSTARLTREHSHKILFAVARKLGQDRERQKAAEVLRKENATFDEEKFDR
jgi:hypothetical protein